MLKKIETQPKEQNKKSLIGPLFCMKIKAEILAYINTKPFMASRKYNAIALPSDWKMQR